MVSKVLLYGEEKIEEEENDCDHKDQCIIHTDLKMICRLKDSC